VNVNADFIICEQSKIHKAVVSGINICDWWIINEDISEFGTMSWVYMDMDLWFWWKNEDFNTISNLNNNIVIWFFDEHINTIIKSNTPIYSQNIGYIWTTNEIQNDFNEHNVIWFFSENFKTVINNKIPDYVTPIWFMWDIKTVLKKNTKIVEKYITYRLFFKEIIERESKLTFFQSNYTKTQYNIFLSNIISLLDIKNVWKIDKEQQYIIENKIKNSWLFRDKISKLTKHIKFINDKVINVTDDSEKNYIIKYILKK